MQAKRSYPCECLNDQEIFSESGTAQTGEFKHSTNNETCFEIGISAPLIVAFFYEAHIFYLTAQLKDHSYE